MRRGLFLVAALLTVVPAAAAAHTLHYAAPYDMTFNGRMLDAVYAFQKVQGLPRTGAPPRLASQVPRVTSR